AKLLLQRVDQLGGGLTEVGFNLPPLENRLEPLYRVREITIHVVLVMFSRRKPITNVPTFVSAFVGGWRLRRIASPPSPLAAPIESTRAYWTHAPSAGPTWEERRPR